MASVPSAPTTSAPPAPTLDSIMEAITWLQRQGKDPEFCVKKYLSQDQSGHTRRVQLLADLPEPVLHAWVETLPTPCAGASYGYTDSLRRPNTASQTLPPWARQSSLPITPQSAGPRPADNVIQPTPSWVVSGDIRESANSTHNFDENFDFGPPLSHSTPCGGASSSIALHNDANGLPDPSNTGGTPALAFRGVTNSSQWEPQLQPYSATPPIPRNVQLTDIDYHTMQSYSTSMPPLAGGVPMPMQEDYNLGRYSHANNGIVPSSGLAEPSANASPVLKKAKPRDHTARPCCGNNWACDEQLPGGKRKADGTSLWTITNWRPHYKLKHLERRDEAGSLHCTHCPVEYHQGPRSESDLLYHIWDNHMCFNSHHSQSSPINNSPAIRNVLLNPQTPVLSNPDPVSAHQYSPMAADPSSALPFNKRFDVQCQTPLE